MSKSKEIILPIIMVVVLTIIPLWFFFNYLGKFIFYQKLSANGVVAVATLISKGIQVDGNLMKPYTSEESDNHQFLVELKTPDNQLIKCQFGVSKSTYDVVSKRDQLDITYLPSEPAKCTLPDSVSLTRYLLLLVLVVASFFMLAVIGFCFYVFKSYKKPGMRERNELTSNLNLAVDSLNCPKCGREMTEGYMPTVGGVSWRDRDEPVGMPTMLSSLPGTTFWIRRPKLHGFHCKSCKIITFKYGKG